MDYIALRLLILSSLFISTLAKCPQPVSLPVTNVALSNGHALRGVPVEIGTPPQQFSFVIQSHLNDTWVYNQSTVFNTDSNYTLCDNDSQYQECITFRGGQYDPSVSSTSSISLGITPPDGDSSDTHQTGVARWISDTIKVGGAKVKDYTFGTVGNNALWKVDPQNTFGLGPNSTLLTTLKAAGTIASKSFSWYYGLNTALASSREDGQVVLGGYDEAKIKGSNYTRPISTWSTKCASGLQIEIKDIELNFPNGTTSSLFPDGSVVSCIQFENPLLLGLPKEPYFDRFESYTQTKHTKVSGTVPHFQAAVYPADDVYQGDITVVVNDDFKITISNDLLVLPHETIQSSGAFTSDPSKLDVMIYPDPVQTDIPFLGRQFFTAAYLYVDHDERTYSLWEAKTTSDSNLVAVGDNCAASAPTSTASGSSASGSQSQNSKHHNGLSGGAIAGIVVGSVVGALLIAGAIFFWLRRSKRKQKAEDIPLQTRDEKNGHGDAPEALERHEVTGESRQPPELDDSSRRELSGVQNPQELSEKGAKDPVHARHELEAR